MNQGKPGLDAERFRAVGVVRSLPSKKRPAAGTCQKTHFLSNKEKKKWIEDYVDRETAVARKLVKDAETATEQVQDDMWNAENAGLTTTKPEPTFEEMLNGIRDSLSDLENYDHELDGKDEDHDEDDPAGSKLRKNNEPGWVMDTISETVQYRMECFRQKQMKLGELVQPGRGDSVDYICERDKMYGMTELMVPAVI